MLIAREHGISEATFYNWNRGAGATEVRRDGSLRTETIERPRRKPATQEQSRPRGCTPS
ncbi:transposase [Spirosoma agri]|uniref:transposase n=1 Tax=Spirosoma agri TaxID=1987381 RepID=UPI003743F0B5